MTLAEALIVKSAVETVGAAVIVLSAIAIICYFLSRID